MHEMAIAESLVEQVGRFTPPGAILREVHLQVGGLEHIEPEALRTAWTVLTDGTGLAGAELCITREALRVRCRECGKEFEPDDPVIILCPQCGTSRPEILQGMGVLLQSLEVDQPETSQETVP